MRADSFFTNLTKQQSMLLLIAVTYGGAEHTLCFDHLPEEEGKILRERAQKLLEVPREKRIPFLVQEIKRLVVGRRGGDLRGTDPAQLARALKGERPALAEVILRALPASLAEQVRNEIPPSQVKLGRAVRPEILSVIRWHFERQLQQAAPRQASFLFADALNLSAKDLLTLADHLGADDLGPAVAGLEPAEREALLRALPAEQRALCARAASVAASRKLDAEAARKVLTELAGENARHTVRLAGLRRLIRACLGESAEFASRLAERHRDELGRMLIQAIRTERAHGRARNGEQLKIQLLTRLEQLAERGLVERPVRLQPPPSMRARPAPSDFPASSLPPVPPPPRRPKAREMDMPVSRVLETSPVKPDPSGSAMHRDPRLMARTDREPGGSAIHRGLPAGRALQTSPGRPRVVRGGAAAQARPARPPPDDPDDR